MNNKMASAKWQPAQAPVRKICDTDSVSTPDTKLCMLVCLCTVFLEGGESSNGYGLRVRPGHLGIGSERWQQLELGILLNFE